MFFKNKRIFACIKFKKEIKMKISTRLLLPFLLLSLSASVDAQLLDLLKNRKSKSEAADTVQQTKEPVDNGLKSLDEVKVEKSDDKPADLKGRHFTYRCYTLNTDVDKAAIEACVEKDQPKMITELQYYAQGEDLRFKEKNNAAVSLQFKDDSPRLIAIHVEDIEDISLVHQLQEIVLKQMGDPTMGFELMKNYDGPANTVWTDYSTYEYMYRYIIGTNVYDFKVTQFGAKTKNGKVIHPYTFSATVNKKSEVALKVSENLGADDAGGDAGEVATNKKKEKKKKELSEDEKLKKDFYPPVGVAQVNEYTVEARMLRAW